MGPAIILGASIVSCQIVASVVCVGHWAFEKRHQRALRDSKATFWEGMYKSIDDHWKQQGKSSVLPATLFLARISVTYWNALVPWILSTEAQPEISSTLDLMLYYGSRIIVVVLGFRSVMTAWNDCIRGMDSNWIAREVETVIKDKSPSMNGRTSGHNDKNSAAGQEENSCPKEKTTEFHAATGIEKAAEIRPTKIFQTPGSPTPEPLPATIFYPKTEIGSQLGASCPHEELPWYERRPFADDTLQHILSQPPEVHRRLFENHFYRAIRVLEPTLVKPLVKMIAVMLTSRTRENMAQMIRNISFLRANIADALICYRDYLLSVGAFVQKDSHVKYDCLKEVYKVRLERRIHFMAGCLSPHIAYTFLALDNREIRHFLADWDCLFRAVGKQLRDYSKNVRVRYEVANVPSDEIHGSEIDKVADDVVDREIAEEAKERNGSVEEDDREADEEVNKAIDGEITEEADREADKEVDEEDDEHSDVEDNENADGKDAEETGEELDEEDAEETDEEVDEEADENTDGKNTEETDEEVDEEDDENADGMDDEEVDEEFNKELDEEDAEETDEETDEEVDKEDNENADGIDDEEVDEEFDEELDEELDEEDDENADGIDDEEVDEEFDKELDEEDDEIADGKDAEETDEEVDDNDDEEVDDMKSESLHTASGETCPESKPNLFKPEDEASTFIDPADPVDPVDPKLLNWAIYVKEHGNRLYSNAQDAHRNGHFSTLAKAIAFLGGELQRPKKMTDGEVFGYYSKDQSMQTDPETVWDEPMTPEALALEHEQVNPETQSSDSGSNTGQASSHPWQSEPEQIPTCEQCPELEEAEEDSDNSELEFSDGWEDVEANDVEFEDWEYVE